jgi:thiol-disulfide isomerase/thioredoxin
LTLLLFVSVCFGSTGCSLFKKFTGSDGKSSDRGSAPVRKEKDTDPFLSPSSNNNNSSKDATAILSGRVLDHSGKPPRDTFIRYRCLDEPNAPVNDSVITDGEGYFQIMNVKPGKRYLLEARAMSEGKVVAGIAQVSAPKLNVEINMREDLAGAHTPAVSGLDSFLPGAEKNAADPPRLPEPLSVGVGAPTLPTAPQPERTPRERTPLAIGTPAATPTTPARPGTWIGKNNDAPNAGPVLNVAINIPVPETQAAPAPPPPTPGFVESPKNLPPTLEITPPPRFPTPPPSTPAQPTKTSSPGFGPASVPSAIVVGRQVVNFALRDVNDSTWELKRHRQGKLILLDFWRTDCVPCLASIPQLNALQNKYPLQTLEVIGIANERGPTMDDKRIQVMKAAKATNIAYRLLMDQNEFVREMRVNAFPTLVLLDDRGYILWEHVGTLDAATASVLDRTIQNQLRR